jgi:lysophospholipase L1-like esterase
MISYFRKNDRVLSFIKFLAWLFVLLLILEVFVRVFFIKSPYLHLIEGLGVVPVDNSVSVWGVEGYGVTHYLGNGEISTPQDSGGISVVVLGDSYTEALQVNDDQKFVSVSESILYERGLEINLHNLGASGRCIADYVYIAPFVQNTYSPDIIVFQISETDFMESMDISRQNFFAVKENSVELVRNKNYYVFDLGLRNMLYSTGLGSLANYKLTPVIKEQRLRLAMAAAQNQAKEQDAVPTPLASDSSNSSSSNPDNSTAAELKPTVFNLAMVQSQFHALREAYPTAKFAFLLIPNSPIIQNDTLILENESDDALSKMLGGFSDASLLYPHEEFVELYTAHQKLPRGFFNTLPGVGHLNPDGNYEIGVALADHLEGLVK